jgi:quercetin dioxygenase-like cupin family protein
MSATLRRNTFTALTWGLLAPAAGLSGHGTAGSPRPVVQVVTGNPTQAGRFVERITLAAGFHTDPHRHSVDLTERVLRGRLMLGLGATFDTTRTVAVLPGSTIA